jgi:hypothetical protein
MRFVKCKRHFAHVHPGNRVETIEPGSVVLMPDDAAALFVGRGNGEYHTGPEDIIRNSADAVERPGLDTRPARGERAVAAPQRAGAV